MDPSTNCKCCLLCEVSDEVIELLKEQNFQLQATEHEFAKRQHLWEIIEQREGVGESVEARTDLAGEGPCQREAYQRY